MLIHLAFDIPSFKGTSATLLRASVRELLRAHRMGHHLLVIGRAEAEWLRINLALDSAEKALLSELALEFTQTADLLRRAPRMIVVVPHHLEQQSQSNGVYRLSLQDAAKPYFLDRVAVIVEDIQSDGGLYSLILQALRFASKANPINWELFHGAGDRLSAVFEAKIAERRVACAIIDTDYDAPRTQAPAKAQQLRAIAQGLKWPHFTVTVLPCREAENLIPLDVVVLLPSAVERQETVNILQSIEALEDRKELPASDRFWLHFDIKQGMNATRVKKLNAEDRAWIEARLDMAGLDLSKASILGFGERVITQLLESNQACAEIRNAVSTKRWRESFAASFSELMWMCLAPRKKIT